MDAAACRWLGVSKFYIMDNNSTMPALLVLWDYIQRGIVDYQYFVGEHSSCCAMCLPAGVDSCGMSNIAAGAPLLCC